MSKTMNDVDYASFLSDKGISPSPPSGNISSEYGHPDPIVEWNLECLTAFDYDSLLIADFLSNNNYLATGTKIDALQNDPKMVYALSRGFEIFLKSVSGASSTGFLYSAHISFQLDEQAASLLALKCLDEDFGFPNLIETDIGVLGQKSLPQELRDRLLLENVYILKIPLLSSLFSKEALLEVAKLPIDKVSPLIRLSNPYISDAVFDECLSYWNTLNLDIFKTMVLSPERWEKVVDSMLQSWLSVAPLHNVAANPSLPYDLACRIYDSGDDHKAIFYSAPNVRIAFRYMPSIKYGVPFYIGGLCEEFTEPKHLVKLYDTLGTSRVAAGVLRNKHTPASLVARAIKDHPSIIEGSKLIQNMRTDYVEPTIWSLMREYEPYKKFYSSLSKRQFEAKLDAVLIDNGLSEILNSPVSWKMNMISLLVEGHNVDEVANG